MKYYKGYISGHIYRCRDEVQLEVYNPAGQSWQSVGGDPNTRYFRRITEAEVFIGIL